MNSFLTKSQKYFKYFSMTNVAHSEELCLSFAASPDDAMLQK